MDVFFEKYPEYKDLVNMKYRDTSANLADALSNVKGLVELDNSFEECRSFFIDLSDVGLSRDNFSYAYDYTFTKANNDSELRYVAYSAYPGGFYYKSDIAKKVIGTDDSETIGDMISTWDGFVELAKKMKASGYYMLSAEQDLAVGLNMVEESYEDSFVLKADVLTKLNSIGAIKETDMWDADWFEDLTNTDVFGFFGCPWFSAIIDSDELSSPYCICKPPQGYCWGGNYLGITKDCSNPGLAALIIYTICNDTDLMSDYYYEHEYMYPNNILIVDGLKSKGNSFFVSGNCYDVYDDNAKKIGQ